MNKKPTLVDVANAAGVSAITVSRALRTPQKVSDRLRKRIQNAIATTGYVPNTAASMLASNTSNAVVVLLPSISNSVFADVLRGIEDGVEETSYVVQIGNTRYDPLKEERIIATFLNPRPAGVIVSGVEQTDLTRRLLGGLDAPVVQIMDLTDTPIDYVVGFSNRDGARAAVNHLYDSGYENIGFLGAQMDPRSQFRLEGYREALRARGGKRERLCISQVPSSVYLGGQLLSSLLVRHPECDAVFCNNDDLALGALFACHRQGLQVPEAFGICGFNDLGTAASSVPTLTSVKTPRYAIGRAAIDIVLGNKDASGHKVRDLGFELCKRASTRKTPSAS